MVDSLAITCYAMASIREPCEVPGTLLKMDVMEPAIMMYEMNCSEKERSLIGTTENLLWCAFLY